MDFTAAVETPIPQTFQVPRARWDELLLRHAEQSGVIVREGHRAVDAAFEPDGVTLRYAGPDGVEQTARVAAVVDASGRAGFLARKLGRYEHDPMLQQVAVHAQYEGVPRAEGRAGRRHPRAHAIRRRVDLADPDLGDGDERGRGGADRRSTGGRRRPPRRRASTTTSAPRRPRRP